MTTRGKLAIISGPTAVGKTGISLELARLADCEIVNADSMQVYTGMDIGTAKIREDEKEGIPHHLFDVISPKEDWNVVRFKEEAERVLDDIYLRNRLPLITGGTAFYIQALLYDIDFSEEEDDGVRRELEERYRSEGIDGMYAELMKADPASCEIIHKNNVKRVIRALEYYSLHGTPISKHNAEMHEKKSPYDFCYFVLTDDRQAIYERINQRVDKMLEAGLLEEVKGLMASGLDRSYVSMQGIGYKEIIAYLEGEISLEEAVYIIKRDTRHFAKRQLTWFRKEPGVIFINRRDYATEADCARAMYEIMKERGLV